MGRRLRRRPARTSGPLRGGETLFAPTVTALDRHAAGGGIEYAFTPNVTARIEAPYVDLGRSVGATSTDPRSGAMIQTGGSDDRFGVVRAGINYKFSSF